MCPIKWIHCEECEDDFPSYAVKPLYTFLDDVVRWFCWNCHAKMLKRVKEMVS